MRRVQSAALWSVLVVMGALWLVVMFAGCAEVGGRNPPPSGDGGGDGSVTGTSDFGLPVGSGFAITPTDPVVNVTTGNPPPTVQFTAALGGQSVPAHWSIDRGEIGSLDSAGLFSTLGTVGGKANVIAVSGANKASTTVTVQVLTVQNGDPNHDMPPPVGAGGYGGVGGDGPGGTVTPAQRGTLTGPAAMDASVKLLYPYDGTVWPRGLLPPLLQWNPGAHHFDSVYIQFHEKNFDYQGFFSTNNGTKFVNLPLPELAWKQLTYSNRGEEVTVTIAFAEGGKAYGPYTLKWKIAQGTLKGTIYYNSYGTYLVQNSGTDGLDFNGHQYGAATLAIKPGATAPVKVAGVTSLGPSGNGTGCRVCHTVSANGKALVTQGSTYDASDYSQTYYYDLINETTMGAGTLLPQSSLIYPALYPDGSLLFSSSGGFVGGGYDTPALSQLFKLPGGTLVNGVKGLPSDFRAALAVFSPDGKHLAFNFWGGSFSGGPQADQHSLALLDFDAPSLTFSKPRIAYTPAAGQPVTFSSFLPNSAGVVFQIDIANPSGTWAGTWLGDTAEVWWYDVAQSHAYRLDKLNGVNYLPDNGGTHPPGQDSVLNYEPTVNPIASGGYAWVVFTSRRLYGNVATDDPWMSDPVVYDATKKITDKKLWVAAVDLNFGEFNNVTDPSHPAFYLPAQEIHAGNSRGFWAVDPCHSDGEACDTGDECCGGYCQSMGGSLVCTTQKPPCAAEYEKCETDADCCGASQGITCINHICSQSGPIP